MTYDTNGNLSVGCEPCPSCRQAIPRLASEEGEAYSPAVHQEAAEPLMPNPNAHDDATVRDSSPIPAFARSPVLEAEVILQELTTRQHLFPHMSLQNVLAQTRACPVAAQRAMEWLALDRSRPIGRVKRAELIQLARSLHRFWKKALAADPASA